MDFIIHRYELGSTRFGVLNRVSEDRIIQGTGVGFSPVGRHALPTPKCKVSEAWRGGHVKRGRFRKLRGADVQPYATEILYRCTRTIPSQVSLEKFLYFYLKFS